MLVRFLELRGALDLDSSSSLSKLAGIFFEGATIVETSPAAVAILQALSMSYSTNSLTKIVVC